MVVERLILAMAADEINHTELQISSSAVSSIKYPSIYFNYAGAKTIFSFYPQQNNLR